MKQTKAELLALLMEAQRREEFVRDDSFGRGLRAGNEKTQKELQAQKAAESTKLIAQIGQLVQAQANIAEAAARIMCSINNQL